MGEEDDRTGCADGGRCGGWRSCSRSRTSMCRVLGSSFEERHAISLQAVDDGG